MIDSVHPDISPVARTVIPSVNLLRPVILPFNRTESEKHFWQSLDDLIERSTIHLRLHKLCDLVTDVWSALQPTIGRMGHNP